MAQINICGIQSRLPVVRLDGHDYMIMSNTYQVLKSEKLITDRYNKDGGIDRQKVCTYKHRWKMTLVVPTNTSYISMVNPNPGESFNFGTMSTLIASDDKTYPNDGLEFYDIESLGIFTGSYTSYVYMSKDWATPYNNDPTVYQVPVDLWGRDA